MPLVSYFDPYDGLMIGYLAYAKQKVVHIYMYLPISSRCITYFYSEKLCVWMCLCYAALCCAIHIWHCSVPQLAISCHIMSWHAIRTSHFDPSNKLLPHARASCWCETQIVQACSTNWLSNDVWCMYSCYTVWCSVVIIWYYKMSHNAISSLMISWHAIWLIIPVAH